MRCKKLLASVILVIILIVTFFSCQKSDKIEETNDTIEQITSLKDASFNNEFNWKSSRIISLNISSEISQIIKVTSLDKAITYHKGMLMDNSETYVIKISIPNYIESLKVNNQEFDLSSTNISLSL